MTLNLVAALIGNPNCGKSTLFNALTGSKQRVGNWPGVTVERKSGYFQCKNTSVEVIDLPGMYSLDAPSSLDERIAEQFVLNRQANLFINVLDASHLERSLYLTLQLIELRVPMIIALNMMDAARTRGMQISISELEKTLGCRVIALEANRKKGIKDLQEAVGACWAHAPLNNSNELPHLASNQFMNTAEDRDLLFADARYRFNHELVKKCVTIIDTKKRTYTSYLDDIVLNRFLGIPIFLAVMYCMFLFAINIGGAFQDFFDKASSTIFVDGAAALLNHLHTPAWLIALIANGVGRGINTTVTFIPVIGAMFLFLTWLEDSGYMARAAFVIDRLMRTLGLPGKAFVPMIVGFGCNVPAVMAARTLENKRDQVLTVMMSPFMSCSARLAIYAVFAAAFFPQGGQNIVFMLYLIGIGMAVFTGFLLQKTILRGDAAPLTMELPAYHLPQMKTLMLHAWQRLRGFVVRAGKLIVPICILLGALNALNVNGTLNSGEGDVKSLLSCFGQFLTPVFAPMGIEADNWPATVGLLTGVLAKEVVIGTLNTLYSQLSQVPLAGSTFHFWLGMKEAVISIPVNLSALTNAFSHPLSVKASSQTWDQSVYGVMAEHFHGKTSAIAYLLFVLLYFPCVSTIAAMVKELNRGWTLFSVLWTTGIAYSVAVMFYQTATFTEHPLTSLIWVFGLLSVFSLTVAGMNRNELIRN